MALPAACCFAVYHVNSAGLWRFEKASFGFISDDKEQIGEQDWKEVIWGPNGHEVLNIRIKEKAGWGDDFEWGQALSV